MGSREYYQALVRGQSRGLWSGIQRGGLRLASWPYGLAVQLRNRLFDQGWKRRLRASAPVVSVGNLTLGGTGKTPCVEYVARHYRRLGLRVALLSRGYGATGGRNDEALVLEENLPGVPHLQGADRVELARTAVAEFRSEVLVLDDGFQHRRLARDLDLVLIDATNPWGYGCLFPRGLLREPASSLGRAGVVVLTRCDQASPVERQRLREGIKRLAPQSPVVETVHRPMGLVNHGQAADLASLHLHPVAAFCGIGNPDAFRRTLLSLRAVVAAFRVFPDHHRYTRSDVEDLRTWAEAQAKDGLLVTTQKDLVKLRVAALGGRPLWALRIGLQVEAGREEFDRRLESVVRQ
jgi:tetraacyldisaccharide 4'-kinase